MNVVGNLESEFFLSGKGFDGAEVMEELEVDLILGDVLAAV